MVDDPELAETFRDAADWREWLTGHHATESAVWIVLTKKGGTDTELDYAGALDEALCFGWIDGRVRSRGAGSFVQRYTPRTSVSAWSARNARYIERLTDAGKMTPAGVAAVDAAKADGRWERAYAGPASAVVPDDLAEAVAADPDAQAMFDKLTSQNRYALVYRLGTVKRQATRERKIGQFVAMLARGETIHPQRRG